MDMVMKSSECNALDRKTQELAYIAVLTAVRLTGGIDFHVKSAKQLGATKEEIKGGWRPRGCGPRGTGDGR